MKQYLKIFVLGILFCSLACSGDGLPKDLGDKLCACRANLLILNKELLHVQEQENQERFIEVLKELENAAEQSEDCTEKVLETAGVTSEKNYVEAMAMMKKACPELAEFFE